MTPVEEIFERIAVALERQATALESIANILDVVTEPPEANEELAPVCFNVRAVEEE